MKAEEKEIIKAVIKTLDSVELSGLTNMNKIVGCASALDSLLIEKPKEENHGK